MVVLTIKGDVDRRALQLLQRLSDMEVVEDAPRSVLITETAVSPVRIELIEADEIGRRVAAGRSPGEEELLAVNAVLDDDAAARLEDAGVNYVDAAGRRWLRSWPRTTRASASKAGSSRRLYPASIRLAQLLADHPREPWTQRGLAHRGQTTQTTAHRLLSRLEQEGLLLREGRGPSTERWVDDPVRMRRWLAREARPGKVASLNCFLEDPLRPRATVGRTLALTGAAAAEAMGLPVTTGAAIPMIRVNVRPAELEDVPEALGGFRTKGGANAILIADPERLAFTDTVARPDQLPLAPPSRIMLDLFLEPRGEATVDVYLDLWGDRGD
jgi:hypothetical protein